MWTRKELKDRAKSILRQIYWKAFGVSLVIALAGGNNGGGGGGGGRSHNNRLADYYPHGLLNESSLSDIVFIAAFILGILILIAVLRIFLGYPLEVGGRKYFIQSAQHSDNRNCFRYAFNGENYMGIVVSMLRRGVQNLLWYLLLIIPGIVKYYAYSMVPYILADNPNIGHSKAIKLSNEMTEGHKFDMFLLDLSFIGWYILGVLCLGVGVLFVLPYENATKAELYLVLRKNALDGNLCSYEDILFNHTYNQEPNGLE